VIGRRRFCRVALGVAGAALLGPSAARAARAPNEVLVGLPNNVYANYQEGKPNGIMVQAIDTILLGMGRQPVYIVMPSSVLNTMVAAGKVAVSAVAFQSSRSPKTILFSDPIVVENNIVAVLRGKRFEVAKVEDLYGHVLGGRTGFAYPLLQDDPKVTLNRFGSDAELLRNLIFGRIDAAIISAISDLYKLRSEGVMARIEVLDVSLGSVPLRAALSSAHFTPEDHAEFNRRLAEIKEGPQWLDILDRNGMGDLVHDWPTIAAAARP
jgi:ABC-type amino acid transport substrate-binding protein